MKERPGKGSNIIDFPDKYVCVDVETTGLDFEYDEIIEIGAAIVENGKVIDTFSSLVKPERSHGFLAFGELKNLGYSNFEDIPYNVLNEYYSNHLIPEHIEKLTGITNEDLASAPRVEESILKFLDFIKEETLVGHNVNFDINFLYDACARYGKTLSNNFIDTMRISRKMYPDWEHHRLEDLVSNLEIQTEASHRAIYDAVATVNCFEKMKEEVRKTKTLNEFISSFKKKRKSYCASISQVVPTVSEFDDTNPVFEKVVVFTGALSSMSRKEAFQIVANLGGYPENTITKKTNFLVVGNEEFVSSVKNGKTKKMQKADSYKEKGIDIVTLSENTFFEMINN